MSTFQFDFESKYDIIDTTTPRQALLSGMYKKSFAYYTLHHRFPIILTEIIDLLNKDKEEISALGSNTEEAREELKIIVGKLSKLKYQLQTDKPFEKFNGVEPDKNLWNTFLDQLPKDKKSFFSSCWLYVECYTYRKVASFFENTKHLKKYDYFSKFKQTGLDTPALLAVAKEIRVLEQDPENEYKEFENILKLSLWGNKCDLSLKTRHEFKPNDNVFEEMNTLNQHILINDLKKIWNCLKSADKTQTIIVDLICDNAGFELYTDLILADYLIERHMASKVRFSVKPIPWYVSDAGPNDIHFTLDYLSKHESYLVKEFGEKCKKYFDDGQFVISPAHYFWVSGYEYYKMREISLDLYNYLKESHLIIFKGDLNYRKLLGDVFWDFTEDFLTCLRGFGPTNICTLRSIKADLICGLPMGKEEELNLIDPHWMRSGEFGVIQFMEKTESVCTANKADCLIQSH